MLQLAWARCHYQHVQHATFHTVVFRLFNLHLALWKDRGAAAECEHLLACTVACSSKLGASPSTALPRLGVAALLLGKTQCIG